MEIEPASADDLALRRAAAQRAVERRTPSPRTREFRRADEEGRSNKIQALEAVREKGLNLANVTKDLHDDFRVVMDAVKNDGKAIFYASPKLRTHYRVISEAVQSDWEALIHVPHELRQDRAFMFTAVEDNWRALFFANEELRSDRDLARIAVAQSSEALQLLSPELRTDYEFILLAVRQNWKTLADVPTWAREDRTVVELAVKQNWQALALVPGSVCGDRDLMYEALTQSWQALQYASDELRKDRELVRRAVQQDGRALKYASKDLQADRDLVLEAIQRDGESLQFASEGLRLDQNLVIEAVKRDWRALEHVPDVIRKDRCLAFNVVRQDPMALTCLSDDLRADPTVILEAARQSWTPRDTSAMAEEDCVGCERLLRMHNPTVSQATPAAVLTPLSEEQLMKPLAHREGTQRSRFNILERPGKIPEDMRIKSPMKEARCKKSRARLVGDGLGTRLRDGALFVPHSPVLTEPLDITGGSWKVGPGPLPARFRVAGMDGILVRVGVEKDSQPVEMLREPAEFHALESRRCSDGTLRIRIEEPYEGWISFKPSIMRRVGAEFPDEAHIAARDVQLQNDASPALLLRKQSSALGAGKQSADENAFGQAGQDQPAGKTKSARELRFLTL
mmetsp:Transcript_52482/g.98475  ORF Transcript_52482/g.98475 Transcript_52482/m.98475 type:complete len:625 (+) Transcript_52482:37-1911(+)